MPPLTTGPRVPWRLGAARRPKLHIVHRQPPRYHLRVKLRHRLCLLAAACALLAACEKTSTPSAAAKPPKDLVAIVHVPSIERAIAGAEAYADKVMPGASLLAKNAIDAALRLAPGVDRTAPAALFVLAPTGAPPSFGVVASVADGKALDAAPKNGLERKRRGKLVLLGEAATVAAAGDWALSALPSKQALPAGAVARAEVLPEAAERLLRAQTAKLRTSLTKAGTPELGDAADTLQLSLDMMDASVDMLLQMERLELFVFVEAERAELVFETTAKAKSLLAGFASAQSPSDFSLLARLPLQNAGVLAAGQLVLGPAQDAAWNWVDRLLARTRFRALVGEMRKLVALTDGTFAFAGSGSALAMEMSVLYGVTDPVPASAALATSLEKLRAAGPLEMNVPPVSMRSELAPDTTSKDGIRLHHMVTTYDYGADLPAEARVGMPTRQELSWGIWDRVMGLASGGQIEHLIAASRLQTPAPAGFLPLLDHARARKASAVELLDYSVFLSAMMQGLKLEPAPLAIWLAFPEDKLSLGLTVPSASVASIVSAMRGFAGGAAGTAGSEDGGDGSAP